MGINGQRIAIVGYSYFVEPDDPGYVVSSIQNVIGGKWPNVRFYSDIAGYFGMPVSDFYERVIQFEFVPCSVGGRDQRYAWASKEQKEVGIRNVLRVADEQSVDKLLFFSGKAWKSMPPTVERMAGAQTSLGDTKFEVGHYQLGGRRVTAVGLRHPQYASRALMTEAVELSLALPLSG